MLSFVVRRLLATVLVLVAASFVVYNLTANYGDPLADLKGSKAPNRQELIDQRIEMLNLNEPSIVRYVYWLGGAAKCLIGQCDLGQSYIRGNQPVTEALASAAGSTIQLITVSTIVAIVFGVAVGMITALRQYSGFDYTVTFFTFVLYSLPVFWVAVLLKEFGAIRFNDFMANPAIPWWGYAIVGLIFGVTLMSIVGGPSRTRLLSFGIGAVASVGILLVLVLTGWFQRPTVGIIGILITGAAITVVVSLLSTGLKNRRALMAAGATVVVWAALWQPLQFLFFYVPQYWVLLVLAIVAIGIGVLSGMVFGRDDKRELARTAAIVSVLTYLVVVVDRVLLVFPDYTQRIPLKNGIIATIGATTPGLRGDIWFQMLDSFAHLLLPTIALTLISFAAYTRYARSSLLEVMNLDYVRTARAKGLTERTVIMRHAFRNAMIPIATIVALDIGALIGGAVITEEVFAWQGMGQLFVQGLDHTDVNLVMGFFLLTGVVAVIFNILADIVYAALDPRIRVS
ncbi:ABC transporter permease [Ruicaihuangia caeni]|uniref:ABC transporter permease n=1 Tax=Ruicaihuangia caeni TaxID=3042517 RepID=A0AAW6T948_9MICO|nr:ABC transporter permease [Klugiella sp. YN-L-19]MDI2099646.1 ABC transporter permease [Klugiella sp. YN-L-19]